MPCDIPHTIRPGTDVDMPFVRSNWLRSMSDAAAYRWLPEPVLHRVMWDRIGRWCKQHAVWIAHAPGDADQLLGFICAGQKFVLYAYVKQAMRRLGLARALVMHAQGHCRFLHTTHWGDACEEIARLHPLTYKPTLLKDPRRRQVKVEMVRQSTPPPTTQ